MPRFAVLPHDVGDTAALTAGEASALDAVRRLVLAGSSEAVGALGPADSVLVSAVEGYGQVEAAVVAALAEAAGLLSGALAAAAVAYASADSGGALAFGTVPGGEP